MSDKRFSFTQLSMFLKCGMQYYNRYILGLIKPPSGALVRGRNCHKAEADNFKAKIDTNEFLPVEAVEQSFCEGWKEEEGQIAWLADELDGDSPKLASGKMKDSGIRLIRVFHEEQLKNCHPIEIESEFTVDFEGGYPKMVGRFDRIDKNFIIAEEKFVKKSPPDKDVDTDIQLTAYDLGHRVKFGCPPRLLQKQWAIDTKEPKTVIQTCLPRSEEQMSRFLRRLESAMTAIEKGVFLPCPGDSWVCSPQWCGYWSSCKVKP